MNKAIVITLLTFGLVIGFSVPEVFAVEQTSQAEGVEKVERGWDQAIKTQLGLAKASMKEKEGQARNQLSDLLIQAANIVKGRK